MTCGSPCPRQQQRCWLVACPRGGNAGNQQVVLLLLEVYLGSSVCRLRDNSPRNSFHTWRHIFTTVQFWVLFKYRESECWRAHGSFLLRVVLCRGKICRAGPISFSSSSSTPGLGLPSLASAICSAGKEPQTLGFLVASHLHRNLLQNIPSWPSIATCMQQALKPLPFFCPWKQVLGLSLYSPCIFTHKSHLAAVMLITPFASTTLGSHGPPAVPFPIAGAMWGAQGWPQPTGINPFSNLSFPFLANEGVSPPSSAGQFPSDVLLRCLTKYY